MKIRIIVGLPGSGKTTYANQNPLGIVFDDPAANVEIFSQVKNAIKAGQDITITDIYMADPSVRLTATKTLQSWKKDLEIEWIFFANDPQACIANVERRDDGRIVSAEYIQLASEHYSIPDNAKVLPVFKF